MKKNITIVMLAFFTGNAATQQLPGLEENIPFMVTFSKNADKSWGDDDFCQIAFMVIPKTQKSAVYLRIFDPDVGGK
ncbi:MAG TPA: hypothetical protein VD905_13700, partial [Flavobacteriales bacterium]|nr:hypothetical protein [Flavobacteriales bacterium]